MTHPKVLITNGYTWHNKGDAAIVIGMAMAIKHHVSNAEITLVSFTPETDNEHYRKWDVATRGAVVNPYPVGRNRFHTVVARAPAMGMAFLQGLAGRAVWPGRTLGETLRAYKDADIVVGCGGGYLGASKFQSLPHLYGLWLGKRFGKPTVLYSHSVVPFRNSALGVVTKRVLDQLDLVLCREQGTYDYLSSIGIRAPLRLVPDAAFLLEPLPRAQAEAKLASYGIRLQETPLVGLTVRNWGFPGTPKGRRRMDSYVAAIAGFVSRAVHDLGAQVILYPQVTFAPQDDDRKVSEALKSSLPATTRDYVHVITDLLTPSELKGMIGCMDLFVGTRMHSNIFALSQHVPSVAIAYEPKTQSIMEMLGLGGYVIDIGAITEHSLWTVFQKSLYNRNQIRSHLVACMERTQAEALSGGAMIANLLERRWE